MKVGLLTFHNTLNYGSALQVFATQEALKKLNIECEIIDYTNQHRKNAYNTIYLAKRELKRKNISLAMKYFIGSVFIYKRKQKFIDFYRKYVNYTDKKYYSNQELKKINTKYDKFIIGSDQVWNYNNNGNDFSYLLDFVEEKNKKVSYSSSFGLKSIPDKLTDQYTKYLSLFKYLSTREDYGRKIIKELTGKEAELVLDPVFLLDKDDWLSFIKNGNKRENYIFCYTNRSNQIENFLNQTQYPLINCKIYKLSRYLTPKDFINPKIKVCYSISPIDFIEIISQAKLVITASFHCVAMAIILQVPFIAILTGDEGKDERILNILKMTGLEKRLFNKSTDIGLVNKVIDFSDVEKRIQKYREISLNFLENACFD